MAVFLICLSDVKKIISLSDIWAWTVCIDRSPDLDVAGSTSVRQETDEKFQDWNMSGGFSQSQPWGREKAMQPCAVNLPADTPQALSACSSSVAGVTDLALNHTWSCWGSMEVDKKGLQKTFSEKCPSVLWCSTSPQHMPPQHGWTAAAHADTQQQAAEYSDTPRLHRFAIAYIWRVRKTTLQPCNDP